MPITSEILAHPHATHERSGKIEEPIVVLYNFFEVTGNDLSNSAPKERLEGIRASLEEGAPEYSLYRELQFKLPLALHVKDLYPLEERQAFFKKVATSLASGQLNPGEKADLLRLLVTRLYQFSNLKDMIGSLNELSGDDQSLLFNQFIDYIYQEYDPKTNLLEAASIILDVLKRLPPSLQERLWQVILARKVEILHIEHAQIITDVFKNNKNIVDECLKFFNTVNLESEDKAQADNKQNAIYVFTILLRALRKCGTAEGEELIKAVFPPHSYPSSFYHIFKAYQAFKSGEKAKIAEAIQELVAIGSPEAAILHLFHITNGLSKIQSTRVHVPALLADLAKLLVETEADYKAVTYNGVPLIQYLASTQYGDYRAFKKAFPREAIYLPTVQAELKTEIDKIKKEQCELVDKAVYKGARDIAKVGTVSGLMTMGTAIVCIILVGSAGSPLILLGMAVTILGWIMAGLYAAIKYGLNRHKFTNPNLDKLSAKVGFGKEVDVKKYSKDYGHLLQPTTGSYTCVETPGDDGLPAFNTPDGSRNKYYPVPGSPLDTKPQKKKRSCLDIFSRSSPSAPSSAPTPSHS